MPKSSSAQKTKAAQVSSRLPTSDSLTLAQRAASSSRLTCKCRTNPKHSVAGNDSNKYEGLFGSDRPSLLVHGRSRSRYRKVECQGTKKLLPQRARTNRSTCEHRVGGPSMFLAPDASHH